MKRPSRTDLLAAIASLQGMIGAASAAAGDRNPNRAAQVRELLDRALELCIEARSGDPPTAGERSKFANRDHTSTAI